MKESLNMNKFLKTTLTLILLTFSMQLFALTDAEEIEFSGAVNEGKLPIVKKYVEVKKSRCQCNLFCMESASYGRC